MARGIGTSGPAAGMGGIAAIALGGGLGELVGALTGTSPVSAIDAALINLAPAPAKDSAIALFGTADKIALIAGVLVVLVAAGIGAGLLERRIPAWGRTLLAILGVAGIAASVTRADAGALSWLAPIVAAAAAMVTLAALLRRAPVPAPGAEVSEFRLDGPDPAPASPKRPLSLNSDAPDRRSFLVWTGAATGLGVLAAIGGTALRVGSRAVAAVREALRLPAATNTITEIVDPLLQRATGDPEIDRDALDRRARRRLIQLHRPPTKLARVVLPSHP